MINDIRIESDKAKNRIYQIRICANNLANPRLLGLKHPIDSARRNHEGSGQARAKLSSTEHKPLSDKMESSQIVSGKSNVENRGVMQVEGSICAHNSNHQSPGSKSTIA